MLINKLGTESDDEIVDMGSRRPLPDPHNRETMTMLLQMALRPVPRSELLATATTPDATVSVIESPVAPLEQSSQTDVA